MTVPAPGFEEYITQASGDARYQQLSSIGTDTPDTIQPDDAANAGVSTAAARGDHQHGIVAATASGLTLLSTNTEGVSTSFARADHTHSITWNPPACRVFHSVDQSYASSTASVVSAFNSERYDTDNMHSTSVNTSRITFNTAGLYTVTGSGVFASNTTGDRFIGVRLNGTTFITVHVNPTPTNAGFGGHVAVATTYKFAATDYIELLFAQTSGGNLNLTAAGNYSPEFAATWIGTGN